MSVNHIGSILATLCRDAYFKMREDLESEDLQRIAHDADETVRRAADGVKGIADLLVAYGCAESNAKAAGGSRIGMGDEDLINIGAALSVLGELIEATSLLGSDASYTANNPEYVEQFIREAQQRKGGTA